MTEPRNFEVIYVRPFDMPTAALNGGKYMWSEFKCIGCWCQLDIWADLPIDGHDDECPYNDHFYSAPKRSWAETHEHEY